VSLLDTVRPRVDSTPTLKFATDMIVWDDTFAAICPYLIGHTHLRLVVGGVLAELTDSPRTSNKPGSCPDSRAAGNFWRD